MNSREHDDAFDPMPFDERRWQAQERARRGEADADAGDLRIARALRHAPPVELPLEFAAQVAALAHGAAQASGALEQRLLRGLGIAFALSAAAVVAWCGRGWAADLAAVLPGGDEALGWCVVAGLCLLVNWGLGAMKRRWVAPVF